MFSTEKRESSPEKKPTEIFGNSDKPAPIKILKED